MLGGILLLAAAAAAAVLCRLAGVHASAVGRQVAAADLVGLWKGEAGPSSCHQQGAQPSVIVLARMGGLRGAQGAAAPGVAAGIGGPGWQRLGRGLLVALAPGVLKGLCSCMQLRMVTHIRIVCCCFCAPAWAHYAIQAQYKN